MSLHKKPAQTSGEVTAYHAFASDPLTASSALARIRHASTAFCEAYDDPGHPDRARRSIALLHQICAAIDDAEVVAPGPEILAAVAGVRARIAESPLGYRLQAWPRGYPGDFETIEMLCRGGNEVAPSHPAYFVQQWAMDIAPVRQHRNKVKMQAALMADTLLADGGDDARVLSIASGPSGDVRVLAPLMAQARGTIWLNDSDSEALAFAASRLGDAVHHCRFAPGNIFRLHRTLAAEGPFDLVVAGGLFDYLNEKQASHLVDRVYYTLLKPGGRFFFTNIQARHPYRALMNYLVDWRLIERSADDMLRLCTSVGIPRQQVALETDETGLTWLATITRAQGPA